MISYPPLFAEQCTLLADGPILEQKLEQLIWMQDMVSVNMMQDMVSV